MKIINITYSIIFAGLVFLAAACSDVVTYNDGYDDQLASYGPPSVSRVTTAKDTVTAITESSLAEMITLHGNNLTDVTSIFINDVEVDLSTIYAVRTRLTLPIPRVLPMEVNNQIKITTKLGTVNVPLTVNLPELVLTGFYNEFAHDGDTVRFLGNNFDLYEIDIENATMTMNGKNVNIIDADATGFSIEIPEGTTDNSVLSVSTPKLTTPLQLKFRETGYSILTAKDMEEAWNPEGLHDGTAEGDPDPLRGKFYRVKYNYSGYWTWHNITYARFDVPDVDIINNPENYWVKYEINNNINYPLVRYIRVGRNNDGDRNYMWDPTPYNGGVTMNTLGKWKTVKFEVTDLFRPDDPNSGKKTNLFMPVEGADRNHFIIVNQPENPADVDFSICNFRFVKKN